MLTYMHRHVVLERLRFQMGTRVRVVITHVHVPLYVVNLNLSIASKKYTVTKILQELIVNFYITNPTKIPKRAT